MSLISKATVLTGAAAVAVGVVALAPSAAADPAAAHPGAAVASDNFAPASRTVTAQSIYRTTGDVTDPSAVLHGGVTTLHGAGASVTLDFGEEVGGLVTVHSADSTDAGQRL